MIRVILEYTHLSIAGLSHAEFSWFGGFGSRLKHTRSKRIFLCPIKNINGNSMNYEFLDGH